MVLLFRFLVVMLTSGFRSRIGPLDESRCRFTALPTDCDLNFHLNSGRYLSFMDVGRMDLITRLRLLRPLLKRGWRPVMGGAEIRFRRSVLPMQRFEVRSRVLAWDEKWFYIEHFVERDGQLCATARVRMVVRGREGNIAPRDVLALLNLADLPSPVLPAEELG